MFASTDRASPRDWDYSASYMRQAEVGPHGGSSWPPVQGATQSARKPWSVRRHWAAVWGYCWPSLRPQVWVPLTAWALFRAVLQVDSAQWLEEPFTRNGPFVLTIRCLRVTSSLSPPSKRQPEQIQELGFSHHISAVRPWHFVLHFCFLSAKQMGPMVSSLKGGLFKVSFLH